MKRLGYLIWFSIRLVGVALIAYAGAFVVCVIAAAIYHRLSGRYFWNDCKVIVLTFLCCAATLGMLWAARKIRGLTAATVLSRERPKGRLTLG